MSPGVRVSNSFFFIHGAFYLTGCLLPFFSQTKSCFSALLFELTCHESSPLFYPLAPSLAASTAISIEWYSDSPCPLDLSFETLGLCWATALPDQPPPPDHLENHLVWVDSTKMIPLACCRMSLECLVGTRKFLTTLVTLSLQLWNLTGTALEGYTWGHVGCWRTLSSSKGQRVSLLEGNRIQQHDHRCHMN
jgi:hypothetical protein